MLPPAKKIIYLVRHGQSEGNVSPVFQGHHSALTETGLQQAKQVAARAARLSFDTIVASPLKRAKQTADQIAAATDKPIIYSELFIEREKPSAIRDKNYQEPEVNRIWHEWSESLSTPKMRVGDGENFDDLLARATKALDFLYQQPADKILVVTHGYFLRSLVAMVVAGDALTPSYFKNFHRNVITENTGVTVLAYHDNFEAEPGWHLWVYNDHSHLG